ncbi:hypothetical protein [Fructobacillus cardui]|uniref:Uncharacterized protein n=1 Tax=Fructobacillus cardui TaxID=2893170 RepID=A0ABM9N2H5_9LACO|nr:unnamed protein product [Fructobacillus cardui]
MKKIITVVVIILFLISGTILVFKNSASQSGKHVRQNASVSSRSSQTSQFHNARNRSGEKSSSTAGAGSDENMISNLPSPNTNSTVPLSQQKEEIGQGQPVTNGQEAISLVKSLPGQYQNDIYQLVPDKLFGDSNENIFDVKILSNSNNLVNEPTGVYRVYRDGHYELLQPYTYFDFVPSSDQLGQGSPVSNGQEAINLISSIDYDPDHNYRLVYDPLFLTSNPDIFDVQVLSKQEQALGKLGIEGVYRVYKDGHYEFLRP